MPGTTLMAANRPPVARNDVIDIRPEFGALIAPEQLLGNDSDPDGDALTLVSVSAPSGDGSVELLPEGGIVFFGGFTEPVVTFGYTVADPSGAQATATVTVTLGFPPLEPLRLTVAEDGRVFVGSYVIALGGGTAYDQPDHGTVTQEGNPDYTREQWIFYNPAHDFHGTDSFTLSYGGWGGPRQFQEVIVTVLPTPDAPVARGDTATILTSGRSLTLATATLLANDTDADGDALTVTAVGGARHGSVALKDGAVTFTAEAGFTGQASFTYTVSDGTGRTDTATVAVTVTAGTRPGGEYVHGTAAGDLYEYRSATTRLMIAGLEGNDTIRTGSGNDALNGGGGDDILNGGAGEDLVTGGRGVDRMAGGAGVDNFAISRGDLALTNATDWIVDFEGAGTRGGDLISFRGFGPGAHLALLGTTGGRMIYEVQDAAGENLGRLLLSTGGKALWAQDYYFL